MSDYTVRVEHVPSETGDPAVRGRTMTLSVTERETAQQFLANGWSPAKTAHALLRARRRNLRSKQIGWLFGVAHLMGDEAVDSQSVPRQ